VFLSLGEDNKYNFLAGVITPDSKEYNSFCIPKTNNKDTLAFCTLSMCKI